MILTRIFNPSKTLFIKNIRFLAFRQQFCTQKPQTQLKKPYFKIPIINNSPILYIKQNYSKFEQQKKPNIFSYYFPVILLTGYGCFQGWSTIIVVADILFFLLGFTTKGFIQGEVSKKIQAVEISRNLDSLFFTIPTDLIIQDMILQGTFKYLNLQQLRKLNKQNFTDTTGFYNPIKNKKPFIQQSSQQKVKSHKQWIQLQLQYSRIQIPKEKILAVKYILPKNIREEQVEQDKFNLSFQDFVGKYKQFNIQITFNIPLFGKETKQTSQKFKLILSPNKCSHNTNYFQAMIYGLQISVEFDQPSKQRKNIKSLQNSMNQQKQNPSEIPKNK